MDFISGDLDRIFTVLYELGRVEPLLKKDWKALYKKTESRWAEVARAIHRLNVMDNFPDMRAYITELPSEIVDALVLEVARELAEFQGRGDSTLH